jgi:hypothetical protein
MENLIKQNLTQQQATQVPNKVAKTILPTQITSGGAMIFILFAVIIAVWWVNQVET